jgi:CheY-like chemotaxis protein
MRRQLPPSEGLESPVVGSFTWPIRQSPPVPRYATREHDACVLICDEAGEGVRRPMATILLIDDEESVRTVFQVALERAGYRVLTAENGKLGLRLLEHQEVDLILVDIFMPDMDGLEVILRLRESRCASKMIAITGRSGMKNFLDIAKHLGAHDTLMKPFSVQELLDAVSAQLGQPDPASGS